MYSINKKLVLKGENKMNVMDQPNGVKVKYEEPEIDIVLFACVSTDSVSDSNEGEWDELD